MTQIFYQLPVYRDGRMDWSLELQCDREPGGANAKLRSRLLYLTRFPHPNAAKLRERRTASLMSVRI